MATNDPGFKYSYDVGHPRRQDKAISLPQYYSDEEIIRKYRKMLIKSAIAITTAIGVVSGIYWVANKGYTKPPSAEAQREGGLETKIPK